MRIGLDVWPATTHGPGIGRYLRELVGALARIEGDHELRLLDVGPGVRPFESAFGGALDSGRVTRRKARAPRRALALAASLGIGADRWLGGCDLFHHALPGEPRVSRARTTLALARLPEEGADLSRYDAVITFSAWGADEIARLFALPRERVHALPVGCEHFARDHARLAARPAAAGAPADLGVRDVEGDGRATPFRPDEWSERMLSERERQLRASERRPGGRASEPRHDPVVLCLGRLDRRRAPTTVLAAAELLRERGVRIRLAFVGRRGDAYDELRARTTRSPVCAAVSFVSDPTERELAASIAGASVLLHLSEGELSPVTPLEALACGAAVVATRAPAFVEALGSCARWIDAPPAETDREALAAAVVAALEDAADPAATARRRELAAAFTWERHARATLDLWRGILARR